MCNILLIFVHAPPHLRQMYKPALVILAATLYFIPGVVLPVVTIAAFILCCRTHLDLLNLSRIGRWLILLLVTVALPTTVIDPTYLIHKAVVIEVSIILCKNKDVNIRSSLLFLSIVVW